MLRHFTHDLTSGKETFLSILPLSHAYEHSVGLFFPIHIRAEIYLLQRPETLASAMLETKPTIMTAVPRLYEILKERIHASYQHKGVINRKIFNRAIPISNIESTRDASILSESV